MAREDSGIRRALGRIYAPAGQVARGKVLIVESDPDIARMLEVRLSREGHEVLVTTDGAQALKLAGTEVLDAALIDRQAAGVSGFDLLSRLKEMHRPFEAILTSFDPTTELQVKAYELGAFDLIVKPFAHLKVVSAKLGSAIAKVRAERDRDELARVLAAQTQDLVHREQEAERHQPSPDDTIEEEIPAGLDLDGMSGVDPLSGLPNRRAADERFRKETARALRYDRPLCIALASVDGLEAVVQRFGAEGADGVLRGIASMFSSMVRDVDFCARLQGGEFFFLFPETPKDAGFIVVERIRVALAQAAFAEMKGDDDTSYRITASFGVAGLPTDTLNAERLRDAAEEALSQAKNTGDRVVLFEAPPR